MHCCSSFTRPLHLPKLISEVLSAGDTRHLTQLTSSLMGKENLVQDASALVDLGLKLQQALSHAQALRRERLAGGADEGCNGALHTHCCALIDVANALCGGRGRDSRGFSWLSLQSFG